MWNITGRGWEYPIRLNDRNQISMVEHDADIRQAIRIILNTIPGERVMRPEFGCYIHELIFWPANEETASIAERYVTEAIKRWEPRIDLKLVMVTPVAGEEGALVIDIAYEIKATHDVRSLVYPFYLTPA